MRTQLHHILAQMAAKRPDAPALTIKDTTRSYAELWAEAHAFAGGLAGIGLSCGERVGIYLDKQIETVASVFGTSAIASVISGRNARPAPSPSSRNGTSTSGA